MSNLAFLDQPFDRARNVLDGHLRIDSVLIEHIDRIDPKPLPHGIRDLANVLRPAVEKTFAEFERREGVTLLTKYNGCGILVADMRAGEHPDAYFACDKSFMDQVSDLFIDAADVSTNRLVILVKKGNPRVEVTLVDVDESRAEVASALGAGFARPEDAAGGCDLVVHTSATSAGLQRALDLLAPEGTVLDLSWYGDEEVRLQLGGAFHAGRLGIRASQVGTMSPARGVRRTTADRLALALDLLRDPAFDVLVTGESRFDELPGVMERLAAGSLPALCHTITYDAC